MIKEQGQERQLGKRSKTDEEIGSLEERLANMMTSKKKKAEEEWGPASREEVKRVKQVGRKGAAKEGHHIVESGDKFRAKDGRSDALRRGEMEPFAYIRLNPAMMNKRNRNAAVKSFEPVVGGSGALKGVKLKKRMG